MAEDEAKKTEADPSVSPRTEVSSAVLNPVYLQVGEPDTPKRFRAKPATSDASSDTTSKTSSTSTESARSVPKGFEPKPKVADKGKGTDKA